MRRVLALAALTAALFAAAGCADAKTTPGGTAATSSSPGAGTSNGADNTTEVCAAAKKVITDGSQRFAQELAGAMTAAATGNSAAADQAVLTLKALLTDWVAGLRTEAGKATNTELKGSLTTFGDEIEKGAAKVRTAQDLQQLQNFETAEMKTATDTLDRLCG